MDPILYASPRDVDVFGNLPDGALANASRIVASVNVTTEAFELDAHGLATDDPVQIRALEGGTLPAPLAEGIVYYAIRVSDSLFSVSLAPTPTSSPIDLTSPGASVVVIKALPINAYLERYSRWIEGFIPAHMVPLTVDPSTGNYPTEIRAIVAQVAAAALLGKVGKDSAVVDKAEQVAMLQVQRWAKGVPLRDAAMSPSANLAVSASLDGTTSGRGWGSTRLP